MDKPKKRGGARPGAGRKPVADEKKVNSLFVSALKQLYKTDVEDDAKIRFIKETLLESQRGQLFVAEHIFGKAPQEIKQTNLNIEAKDLTEEEIKKVNKTLESEY